MTRFLKGALIALALMVVAASFVENPTRSVSNEDVQPHRILELKAGGRFIGVYGLPEKGAYTFLPFIERDDDALSTVLRTIIENQTGKRVAPTMYVSNDSPPWLIIGEPNHQFRVMIFKNVSDGEVYAAHIRPN